MQTCFMLKNISDAKRIHKFLSTQFGVTLDFYLGHHIICAAKKDYKRVVSIGIKFINIKKISDAWWVDVNGNRMPSNSIPLLFAKIPNIFKRNPLLQMIAGKLCHKYAKNFANRLEQTICFHYTPCGNVEFHLARENDVLQNHEYYVEEILKYCLGNKHFFSYIIVCDAYGDSITTINKYRCVEWPEKRPH